MKGKRPFDNTPKNKKYMSTLPNKLTQKGVASIGDHDAVVKELGSSDWAKLAQANPYANYVYNNTAWDSLGNFLGFQTQEDKVRAQMAQASSEYDAQLLQNKREEEYNSEAAQVARQRAAGINPDLNGVAPGQATEFAQEQSSPDLAGAAAENQNQIKGLFSSVMAAATQTISILSGAQTLASTDLNMTDRAWTMAQNYYRLTAEPDSGYPAPKFDPETGLEVLSPSGISAIPNIFASSRNQKKFAQALRFMYGRTGELAATYKGRGDVVDSRKHYMGESSGPYYNKISEGDEILRDVYEALGSLSAQLLEDQLQASIAAQGYNKTYYDNLDGISAARSENAQNFYNQRYYNQLNPYDAADLQNEQNRYTKNMTRMKKQASNTISNLVDKMSKKEDFGSKLFLSLLFIGMNMQPIMSGVSSVSNASSAAANAKMSWYNANHPYPRK